MGVKIGGGEETFLDYILFPLKTGLLRLPSLGVECLAGPVNVIRDVPPTVFVTVGFISSISQVAMRKASGMCI